MVHGEHPDETTSSPRGRRIIRVSWIGIMGNATLAVLKLVVGFTAGSVAVVSDGVDSAMDVLTSTISLVAAKITEKPPDLGHPYGHKRAETIATKTLSFVIFFAGAQLAVSSISGLIEGIRTGIPAASALYVTIASILAKTGLFVYKLRVGKQTNSPMLIADAKNMRGDIVASVAVLTSLILMNVLEVPVLDSITAILISIWIMYVAFRIFLETNSELMEGFEETEMYADIFDAVESVPGALRPHRTRIRKIGDHRIVDLDIEVDGSLTVTEAHDIAQQAEEAITERVANVYDVLVHVEPVGLGEHRERYGVSRETLDREQT